MKDNYISTLDFKLGVGTQIIIQFIFSFSNKKSSYFANRFIIFFLITNFYLWSNNPGNEDITFNHINFKVRIIQIHSDLILVEF